MLLHRVYVLLPDFIHNSLFPIPPPVLLTGYPCVPHRRGLTASNRAACSPDYSQLTPARQYSGSSRQAFSFSLPRRAAHGGMILFPCSGFSSLRLEFVWVSSFRNCRFFFWIDPVVLLPAGPTGSNKGMALSPGMVSNTEFSCLGAHG